MSEANEREANEREANERDLTGLMLRPVRGHHAFESCVEQLATGIRLGIYPDGSTLPPERELADRMKVSRATLREGIAALRSAGMVRTTRGRGGGTVVDHQPGTPSPEGAADLVRRRADLLDSLIFRRVVEPGACHIAAGLSLTDEQTSLLHDSVAAVESATDPGEHRQADSRLHLAIASVTGSELTIHAVTDVQADLNDMLTAIPVLEPNIAHSSRQHRAIVRAIVDGDCGRARRVMESHCDDTAALLRGLLA